MYRWLRSLLRCKVSLLLVSVKRKDNDVGILSFIICSSVHIIYSSSDNIISELVRDSYCLIFSSHLSRDDAGLTILHALGFKRKLENIALYNDMHSDNDFSSLTTAQTCFFFMVSRSLFPIERWQMCILMISTRILSIRYSDVIALRLTLIIPYLQATLGLLFGTHLVQCLQFACYKVIRVR